MFSYPMLPFCETLFNLHHSLSEQFNAECVTQYPDSIIHRYLTVEIDIGKAALILRCISIMPIALRSAIRERQFPLMQAAVHIDISGKW